MFYNWDLFREHVEYGGGSLMDMWRNLHALQVDLGGVEDRLIWMPAVDGNFLVRSTCWLLNPVVVVFLKSSGCGQL